MTWWPQRCEKVKDMGGISKGEAIFFEAFWEAPKSTERWKDLAPEPRSVLLEGQGVRTADTPPVAG